jgi:hypothetical protein
MITYIQNADVAAQLNATYDAVNKVYSVYGLNIAESSLTAHVAFANNYINALLGTDLSASDPKYQGAWMATLDLACIRVLVVSMGGSLVGVFDYFLGDLRVARAGPYKEAITATLQGFKDDLSRQLVNLSTAVKVQDAQAAEDVPIYKGGLITP